MLLEHLASLGGILESQLIRCVLLIYVEHGSYL
jgi:hypothetical protein